MAQTKITDANLASSGTMPAWDGSNMTNMGDGITKSANDPTISTNPSDGVGTIWANTTTGQMYMCTNATAGANIWTNIGGGSGDIQPITIPQGGTVTTDGDYKVHTFTTSGTFNISHLSQVLNSQVEYLVVGGGGGGGAYGGGAGAGGFRTGTTFSVSEQAYTITVGAGGTGGSGTNKTGTDGSDSIFSTITSTGGGGGGGGGGSEGGSGGNGGAGVVIIRYKFQ